MEGSLEKSVRQTPNGNYRRNPRQFQASGSAHATCVHMRCGGHPETDRVHPPVEQVNYFLADKAVRART